MIDDVNPSRSLLCEAEQRSLMRSKNDSSQARSNDSSRSKNDSSRGASKRRSPPTVGSIRGVAKKAWAAPISNVFFNLIPEEKSNEALMIFIDLTYLT